MGLWLGDKPVILERVGPLWGADCHRWTPAPPKVGWAGAAWTGNVQPLALVTAYTIAVSLLPSPLKSTALLTLACLSATAAVA